LTLPCILQKKAPNCKQGHFYRIFHSMCNHQASMTALGQQRPIQIRCTFRRYTISCSVLFSFLHRLGSYTSRSGRLSIRGQPRTRHPSPYTAGRWSYRATQLIHRSRCSACSPHAWRSVAHSSSRGNIFVCLFRPCTWMIHTENWRCIHGQAGAPDSSLRPLCSRQTFAST